MNIAVIVYIEHSENEFHFCAEAPCEETNKALYVLLQGQKAFAVNVKRMKKRLSEYHWIVEIVFDVYREKLRMCVELDRV